MGSRQLRILTLTILSIFAAQAAPRVVVLIRHAEKEAGVDDPQLTAAGRARAADFAKIVMGLSAMGSPVRAIFSSEFRRTQETVAPLAAATGLRVTIVPGADVRTLRDRILAIDGGMVVVSGHSNTVPPVIESLGGPPGIVIGETESDHLFLLTAPGTPQANLVRLEYNSGGAFSHLTAAPSAGKAANDAGAEKKVPGDQTAEKSVSPGPSFGWLGWIGAGIAAAVILAAWVVSRSRRVQQANIAPTAKTERSIPAAETKEPLKRTETPSAVPAEAVVAAPVFRKLRVFLCHSSADKARVRELYRRLREDGIEPWLDEEDLLGGQEWREEIPKAVRRSDAVIVCCSEGSVKKTGYVQKEIRVALDVVDEQPEGSIFVIPLKLEECELPDRLKPWQAVNGANEEGYLRLMRALRARAAALDSVAIGSDRESS